ncbi:MAG: phosphate ABC transporter, permease protein PstA [Phycisphaerales bacterium]|nr:phosphate ABC transporter, permease protein PstA [Phycisphaerales bacterium]
MMGGKTIATTRRLMSNRLFLYGCLTATSIAMLVLGVLMISIALEGWSSVSWRFLDSFASRKAAQAGIKAPLVGSLWVCAICALVALPMGIGTAIYLEEFAKRSRLKHLIQLNISNLSGVPSIVYGILALAAFVRFFGVSTGDAPWSIGDPESLFFVQFPFGPSVLAGGLTLALVVLPIMIIASQEAFRAVPQSLRQGALALGSTPWQVIWRVSFPAALPTIMTGAILAMSRAIGEAAPLLVIGGFLLVFQTPTNLMSDFTVLPLQIFNWAGRPQADFHKLAAAAIIVQLVVLLFFNSIAIIIRQKLQRPLQS